MVVSTIQDANDILLLFLRSSPAACCQVQAIKWVNTNCNCEQKTNEGKAIKARAELKLPHELLITVHLDGH